MMISALNIKKPMIEVMKYCDSYRHMQYNQIKNCDCMRLIAAMPDKSVDFTFTDIPYNMVNHASNGLRRLDKGKANILTFELDDFFNVNIYKKRNKGGSQHDSPEIQKEYMENALLPSLKRGNV